MGMILCVLHRGELNVYGLDTAIALLASITYTALAFSWR